jgi:hypothetical protein
MLYEDPSAMRTMSAAIQLRGCPADCWGDQQSGWKSGLLALFGSRWGLFFGCNDSGNDGERGMQHRVK